MSPLALGAALAALAGQGPPLAGVSVELGAGHDWRVAGAEAAADEVGSRSGGPGGWLGLRLRAQGPLSAWLDARRLSLGTSEQISGEAPGAIRRTRLDALSVTAGPAVEGWRLRARLGLSMARVSVTSRVGERTITPAEWSWGYEARLTALFLRAGRLELGLDARLAVLVRSALAAFTLALAISYDLTRRGAS